MTEATQRTADLLEREIEIGRELDRIFDGCSGNTLHWNAARNRRHLLWIERREIRDELNRRGAERGAP